MVEHLANEQCSHEHRMAYLVDRYQGWRKYECPYCEIERLRAIERSARNLLRLQPGSKRPDSWTNFDGSDAEWDAMADELWETFEATLSALQEVKP